MRVVVAGGSGFLGSHLCEALLSRGDAVCCLDDFSSGRAANINHLMPVPGFVCTRGDVTTRFRVFGHVDAVVHLASPASPPDYQRWPLQTLAAGSRGTENLLLLAVRHRARFVLASTSEVYGDPAVHPQEEEYWGHVNPVGPRSVYDEAKRFAEALTMAYRRSRGAATGIVRIFNTYGPRMRADDGRVVSTFVRQALDREALTVFGDGSQTRSLCYVDDMVRGLLAMVDSDLPGPVNLGNPGERTVRELAELVLLITGSDSGLRFLPLPVDDPVRRRPAITRAREELGWQPQVPLEEGLRRTVAWFAARPDTPVQAPDPSTAGWPS
ncbi:UDP-glucuronic acid decarboxylase family protein [Streptomyces sp. TRM68367]|uniref:UDP-glucuronic acid decarboxylase family protein n=1 Tax=Streptomyces sp. TRM68367 TaxID=2758415 RepID=UPI00165C5457|nr:UDP-glucuronic acid decarboxylase family protein [Streptomyces sp. TRM68367]MBC9727996.1 SDR family oxidoreductase [Streptomyces sp. TRM68367]